LGKGKHPASYCRRGRQKHLVALPRTRNLRKAVRRREKERSLSSEKIGRLAEEMKSLGKEYKKPRKKTAGDDARKWGKTKNSF